MLNLEKHIQWRIFPEQQKRPHTYGMPSENWLKQTGNKTPVNSKNDPFLQESNKNPPPRPCKCHPQYHYNRYPKDRFGIYRPQEQIFDKRNITSTPSASLGNLNDVKLDEAQTEKPMAEKDK